MVDKKDPKESNDYEHVHMHDHDHDYVHFESTATVAKELTLLKYTLDHNRQHVRELAEMGVRFADSGFARASELITEAIGFFDKANNKLDEAIVAVNDPGNDAAG